MRHLALLVRHGGVRASLGVLHRLLGLALGSEGRVGLLAQHGRHDLGGLGDQERTRHLGTDRGEGVGTGHGTAGTVDAEVDVSGAEVRTRAVRRHREPGDDLLGRVVLRLSRSCALAGLAGCLVGQTTAIDGPVVRLRGDLGIPIELVQLGLHLDQPGLTGADRLGGGARRALGLLHLMPRGRRLVARRGVRRSEEQAAGQAEHEAAGEADEQATRSVPSEGPRQGLSHDVAPLLRS